MTHTVIVCGESLMLLTWDHVAYLYYFCLALESKTLTIRLTGKVSRMWHCFPLKMSMFQLMPSNLFFFFFSFIWTIFLKHWKGTVWLKTLFWSTYFPWDYAFGNAVIRHVELSLIFWIYKKELVPICDNLFELLYLFIHRLKTVICQSPRGPWKRWW